MMVLTIYLHKNAVYIPIMVETEAGFYLDREPVETAEIGDTEKLQWVLRKVLTRGNPKIPTPPRELLSGGRFIQKYAGMKSWRSFENQAKIWGVSEKDGNYKIVQKRKRLDRGWEDDPATVTLLPSALTIEEAAQLIASAIQRSSTS